MMGIGVFEMLILLIMLGGGAAVLALIVFALTNNRPGVAVLVGGLAFLGLLLGAGVLFAFLSFASVKTVQMSAPVWAGGPLNDAARSTIGEIQHFNEYSGVRTTWDVSRIKVLFVFGAIVALMLVAGRRLFAHSVACGRGRIWPVFLAVPLLALFFVGNVRYQSASNHAAASRAARVRETIQKQQEAIAKRAAAMNTDMQSRIAKMDIHDLMDKVDAPRIPLAPQAPESPAPPAPPSAVAIPVAQAATANESAATTAEADATESQDKPATNDDKPQPEAKGKDATSTDKDAAAPTADSESSDKKADKAPSDDASKSAETVAESKPSKKSSGNKEEAPAVEKPSPPATIDANKPAPTRPVWVDNAPKRIGDVQREVIVTDEWSTEEECDRARNIGLLLKTYEHIQRLIGAPYQGNLTDHRMISETSWGDHRLNRLASVGITVDYALREIAKDEYVETVDRSVGPMKKIYTLVEFSPAVDHELRLRWDAYERRERFAMVGAGAGSILGVVGLAFALLKIDTWTKGYYTKRLFIGVPAAIITLVALLALEIAR